jgi:flagellar basal body rod protein FlgG
MLKSIHLMARSMHAKMKNMEIVANNLANINSKGYKRQLPFSELVNRFQDNRYKQVSDFSQGALYATGNPLDVSISGKGFFVVQSEDKGLEMTRDGRFEIDQDGWLVTKTGDRVMGETGPVNLIGARMGGESVRITAQGDVLVGEDQVVARLEIGFVENQERLYRGEKMNFFLQHAEDYDTPEEHEYKISQGFLEESNVDPISEMTDMIKLNKDYEAAQKVIGTFDATYGAATRIGKV